jgi:proteasome accessory factor B
MTARPRAANDPLLVLARARRLARRVRVVYRDAGGATTERDVEVFGLAFQEACWYALVHCHLRRALRMFRVDRVVSATATRRAARARPPPGFDAAFLASVEYLDPGAAAADLATIRLSPPLAAAAPALFPSARVELAGGGVLCTVRASRPAALALLVRSLGAGAALTRRRPR